MIMVIVLPVIQSKGKFMEIEDGPVFSVRTYCDYHINEDLVANPDIPEPPVFKRIWYGVGREDYLDELCHVSTAESHCGVFNQDIIFTPKIMPIFHTDSHARIVCRNHVNTNLKKLGFQTRVNAAGDKSRFPDMRVFVSLVNHRNSRLMRIYGPYLMFDKKHMLTPTIFNVARNHRQR